jgi:hypothetical protein
MVAQDGVGGGGSSVGALGDLLIPRYPRGSITAACVAAATCAAAARGSVAQWHGTGSEVIAQHGFGPPGRACWLVRLVADAPQQERQLPEAPLGGVPLLGISRSDCACAESCLCLDLHARREIRESAMVRNFFRLMVVPRRLWIHAIAPSQPATEQSRLDGPRAIPTVPDRARAPNPTSIRSADTSIHKHRTGGRRICRIHDGGIA